MDNPSVYVLARRLEADIVRILSGVDVHDLGVQAGRAVTVLKHQVTDMRLDVRDYEQSETRAEQLQLRKAGHERLEEVRQSMLVASEHNLFSAIEIAQLSAHIDNITERLE